MVTEEIKRVCQGCGREFSMAQAELDVFWNRSLSLPIFCSNQCAMHGWDPQAIWLGRWRRENAKDEEE